MRIIIAITNSFPAVITTSFEHQYKSGTIVRIDVPPADGMQQINQQTGPITVLSTTTFSIPIDTTHYDIFALPIAPPPEVNTCALVVPIGEINEMLTAAVQNVLPYPAT
jgi:hypothetical protein